MAEITDPRGKHLLGEAVRLLVQSGVTGAAITDFITEYTRVLATTLTAPPEPAQPDLRAQIKEALKEALLELAPVTRKSDGGRRKQVSVYIEGAKKTTVFLRQDLLASAAALVGSQKQARQLVKELANSKPADHTNRSAWVEEQLQHRLLLIKTESTLTKHAAH